MGTRLGVIVTTLLASLALAPAAFAQATRTWVSGVGDDANPCSRTAPCATWAGALPKTAAGGEIDALDPGDFGPVTITKAITLSGVGVNAGILASGADAIDVAAGASDQVLLRDINLNGGNENTTPGLNGIKFTSGASLRIEGGEISGFADDGILDQSSPPGSKLIVDGASINDNDGDGLMIAPVGSGSAVLVDDHIDDNACAVVAAAFGPLATTSFTTNCDSSSSGTAATTDSVVLADSTVADNTATGVLANGSSAQEQLTNDLVTGNDTGLETLNSGKIVENGVDNAVLGNVANGSPTSTVDPFVGPTGSTGPTGKQGSQGEVELITCQKETKTKTVKVHGKKKKKKVTEEHCTGKLVKGKVKVTVSGDATMRATLSRGGIVYATGTALVQPGRRTTSLLSPSLRLTKGRYTLTLWNGSRVFSRRSIRVG